MRIAEDDCSPGADGAFRIAPVNVCREDSDGKSSDRSFGAIFVLLFTLPKVLGSKHLLIEIPSWIVIYGVAAFAVVRFGLVALATAVLTVDVLLNVPITLDFSNWYAAGRFVSCSVS